jgi:glycerophosphoryl diester phosphodiesterase
MREAEREPLPSVKSRYLPGSIFATSAMAEAEPPTPPLPPEAISAGSISEPLLIKKLQNEGIHVLTFTVDVPKRMEQLLDWGIESITTNTPDVLTEILKKRNK